MKRISIILVVLLVAVLALSLMGCNFWQDIMGRIRGNDPDGPSQQTLASPTLTLSDGLLNWTVVDGADGYRVQFTDENGQSETVLLQVRALAVADIELLPGIYSVCVRAEDSTGKRLAGAYGNSVRITVKRQCDLTGVQVTVYYVTDTTVLVQCDAIEGVDKYRIIWGEQTLSSSDPVLLIDGIDATADATAVFSVTGDSTHDFGTSALSVEYIAASAATIETTQYDKKDSGLLMHVAGVTSAFVDGAAVSGAASPGGTKYTIDGTALRELSVGDHYLEFRCHSGIRRYALHIVDTRPMVLVNAKGESITEANYVVARYDLRVYWKLYENTVISVAVDGVAQSGADTVACNAGDLVLYRNALASLSEGDHILQVFYRLGEGEPQSVSLTIHCIVLSNIQYDKASGDNIIRNGLPHSTAYLLGGSIQKSDYFLNDDGEQTTAALRASYLATLSTGSYVYLAVTESRSLDESFVIDVYDSGCKPQNVRLDYDTDATITYVRFSCDCGQMQHAYSLDGGADVSADSLEAALADVNRKSKHTLVIKCRTNGTVSDPFAINASSDEAYSYVNKRFSFKGHQFDRFVASAAELTEIYRYISSGGGDFDADFGTKGYGMCSLSVYLGPGVIDDTYQLQNLLNDALAAYQPPISGRSGLGEPGSGEGVTLNADYSGVVKAYFIFDAPISKTTSSGMSPRHSTDPRALLVENGGYVPYIDNDQLVTTTQTVCSLEQLMDLPYGVRPDFASTADGAHARAVYNAVLAVCRTYLADGMTDFAKVETFYHYLTTQVTYDDYSLLWFNLYNNAGYYRQSSDDPEASLAADIDVYLQDSRYSDLQSTLESLKNMTIDQAVATLAQQLHSTAFDAYGAMVNHVAVCDGISDAMYLLCWAENIPCQKVTGKAQNSSSANGENHAWNKVYIDGVWYVLDATWGRSTDVRHTFDVVTHRYCMISDAMIYSNHFENGNTVLDAAVQTVATATEYDYYEMTVLNGKDMVAESWDDFESTVKALYPHRADVPFVEIRFDFAISNKQLDEHMTSLANQGVRLQRSYSDGYIMIWFD